ncbi:MAG: LexA family transcriptional regulator [Gammaproteobacteria bacterium]|uniref:Putative peptidase n=1 Tax=viral metagenome TaxID=1070528 RepID=A0A6M3JAN1_9ZZZZ|nr:LexA family transcriptional regulator [Gammaproteobacteria bacterium]MBU1492243.1 LexA family transcriptional regulator [Gammaproteobacteria bacterium]MBU2066814.1 LexA family transcriptional regulator [Gammaproteobacteria bacterium]MBU2137370.1 LexA family transcriptional regulator [Gammaproteobacteria bacterium]MBU2215069.1 LexA family transcriptional regulator [Gammaproteobacteria bacterium]
MNKYPSIPDIRHANLRRIMQEREITPAELSRILNKSPGQVGQFAGPTRHKGIGDDPAREIEELLGLSPYELDNPGSLLAKPGAVGEEPGAYFTDATFQAYTRGKIPVVGVTAAGAAMEVIDLYQPGVADEWIDAPKNYTPGSFILRLTGFSMQPRFWSEDRVLIEPALEWNPGDYVFAKRPASGDGTFKKLVEEDGRLFLYALNPEFSPRYIELTPDWQIVGKATFRLDKL